MYPACTIIPVEGCNGLTTLTHILDRPSTIETIWIHTLKQQHCSFQNCVFLSSLLCSIIAVSTKRYSQTMQKSMVSGLLLNTNFVSVWLQPHQRKGHTIHDCTVTFLLFKKTILSNGYIHRSKCLYLLNQHTL